MTISFPTVVFDEGEVVTISQNSLTIDVYGDATFSGNLVHCSGLVVPSISSSDDSKSGIIDTKDAVGFFNGSDASFIKDGNDLYCSLGSFAMTNTVVFPIGGTVHHVEAELRKITKV